MPVSILSKYYGSRCITGGNCGGQHPGYMCESDGQGNCDSWMVGDFNLWHLTGDELQKAAAASKTKFVMDMKGTLVEVGLLAASGIRKDDILTGIYCVGYGTPLYMGNEEQRQQILEWKIDKPLLNVMFERSGVSLSRTMKNPSIP